MLESTLPACHWFQNANGIGAVPNEDGVRRKAQKGNGRHCEIVISAHRLANPQWTPLEEDAPEWMLLGFKLYSALEGHAIVYEVFPTASYALPPGQL